jgi:diadenosine tetraphosphate (Ap4A) HIT family hydrolase
LIPESEWLCASPLAFAIFDSFPVSPGHVLVITRRVKITPIGEYESSRAG